LTRPGRAAKKTIAGQKQGQALLGRSKPQHNAPMDRQARNQYLDDLRAEYQASTRSQKTALLDEAEKRTGLVRKVLIRKLAHTPAPPLPKRRRCRYGVQLKAALAELWRLFDCPCGQRLAPLLREQVPRLRASQVWRCSDDIADQLVCVSPKTIDRLLASERRRLHLDRYRQRGSNRALLASIPVKLSDEWDRSQVGNLQLDYVLHCGQSAAGQFLRTLSIVDIATGWWDGEALLDLDQNSTRAALDRIRRRLPFRMREIHPDNDSAFINDLLITYCHQQQIRVSRSRPLKKNDNCWVEQKNYTHVRKLVGYHRLQSKGQRVLLTRLYEAWADWRNFVQPVMRLSEKLRVRGKIHRKYDEPRTPYQRLLDSHQLSAGARTQLQTKYDALNPVTLAQRINNLQRQLLATLHTTPAPQRKLAARSVTFFVTQQLSARLPVQMT
jgi:hypothetical protein